MRTVICCVACSPRPTVSQLLCPKSPSKALPLVQPQPQFRRPRSCLQPPNLLLSSAPLGPLTPATLAPALQCSLFHPSGLSPSLLPKSSLHILLCSLSLPLMVTPSPTSATSSQTQNFLPPTPAPWSRVRVSVPYQDQTNEQQQENQGQQDHNHYGPGGEGA